MRTLAPPIPFAGSQLGENRHVCAFFDRAKGADKTKVLMAFRADWTALFAGLVHLPIDDRPAARLVEQPA
jgi:hypothetical protein